MELLWQFWLRLVFDMKVVLWLCTTTMIMANISAVFWGRNGHPIHGDLFGQNKTWSGLVFGSMTGWMVGMTSVAIACYGWRDLYLCQLWGYDSGMRQTHMLFMSGGALIGDIVKSFFKRRVGIAPGQPWFPFDQLDAVAGGLFFCWLSDLFLTRGEWFANTLMPGRWLAIVCLLLPYFFLSKLMSVFAHRNGLKSSPH